MKLRLNRYLSLCGLASRRKAEILIESGDIIVNGEVEKRLQRIIDSSKDEVFYKKNKLIVQDFEYYKMNKPRFFLTTMAIEEKRKTVLDLLPKVKTKLFPIGRLDYDTEGLLLFTNDGALANKLMHPSSNIEREYVARVHGNVTENIIANLVEGVDLEDGYAKFTDVQEGRKGNTNQWFAMVIMEGRTREVRRLWESQGLEISRLKRVRYGNLFLPAQLKQGAFKELTKGEVNALERL